MRSAYTTEVWKVSYTTEAWMILLIRCYVLSTIMIPTPGSVGKFLHRGSVEKVQHHGRVEDCAYRLLGIEHHNDSFTLEVGRSSYTVEVWRGSYAVEAWTIVLIHFWVSSTTRIPRRGSVEKFLQSGSVDSVQYRGSKDDHIDSLLGIGHHNDSYAVEAWRSSYTMVVLRGSSTVEAGTIMLIL